MLKENAEHDEALKLVKEEVQNYKRGLDNKRTIYRIISEKELEDGSVEMEIIKQYNESPVGDYIK
jgi:hypothetical protein